MSERTALIISCSQEHAATIHRRAESERRRVNSYVLRILTRALDLEEKLSALQQAHGRRLTAYEPALFPGERTTMLLRCSKEEARRIREGAKRRGTTISWFVIYTMALSWSAEERVLLNSAY